MVYWTLLQYQNTELTRYIYNINELYLQYLHKIKIIENTCLKIFEHEKVLTAIGSTGSMIMEQIHVCFIPNASFQLFIHWTKHEHLIDISFTCFDTLLKFKFSIYLAN